MKIAAPELAQTNIGSGAAYVLELFKLAREYAPTIIFIDEIDAMEEKEVMMTQVARRCQNTARDTLFHSLI